jgi:16S rRNA (guanine966-N2)-methyltransferase
LRCERLPAASSDHRSGRARSSRVELVILTGAPAGPAIIRLGLFRSRQAVPPKPANSVRIIGGAWRSRTVRFAAGDDLRPTPDRVRETLFNWLGQDMNGRCCLELYAGTGVLSLEAASRGAALAVAVDRNRAAIDAIASAKALLSAAALELHVADARAFIGRETRRFDVIFLDPPFRSDPWEWLLPACAERLAPGGYLYAEAAHPIQPPSVLAAWRSDRAGQVHYHLFARSAAPT